MCLNLIPGFILEDVKPALNIKRQHDQCLKTLPRPVSRHDCILYERDDQAALITRAARSSPSSMDGYAGHGTRGSCCLARKILIGLEVYMFNIGMIVAFSCLVSN